MFSGEWIVSLPGTVEAIHERLIGEIGWIATLSSYATVSTLAGLIFWKLLKLALAIVWRVALPAAGVALLGAWLLPISFTHLLPVATAVFALLLLIRG
jgi:hypothetical protein